MNEANQYQTTVAGAIRLRGQWEDLKREIIQTGRYSTFEEEIYLAVMDDISDLFARLVKLLQVDVISLLGEHGKQ